MKQNIASLGYRVSLAVEELEAEDRHVAAAGLRLGWEILSELRAIRVALEGDDPCLGASRDIARARSEAVGSELQ